MSVEIVRTNYSLRNSRGTVVLPAWCLKGLANLKVPSDIYAGSTVQEYPLGAKLYLDDKIFRYAKAGDTVAVDRRAFLACNHNYDPGVTGHTNVDGFEGALYTGSPVVAGDTAIKIADTTARAENYYEGAELVLQYDAGYTLEQYRIVASDVGNTSYVKVYIAEPGVKSGVPVSGTAVDAYMNRYSNVQSSAGINYRFFSAVGGFAGAMVSGSFYWLQTGGPITVQGTAGTTTGHRMVYCNTDGSVSDTIIGSVTESQVVGVVFAGTVSGYGTLLVYLTLDS